MSAPDYSELEERIINALSLAFQYGQTDGDHHKAWVIDQMVRALHGLDEGNDFNDAYGEWVADYEGDDGEYTWDTGVAP